MNEYLKTTYELDVGLAKVDEYAAGDKYMQCSVYMSAVNHLHVSELLEHFESIEWEWPDGVQLMLKDEEETVFTVHTPN